MAAEAKVGALFLITIILIVAVAVYLSQYTIGVRFHNIVVHFADVKGLQPGAEVRLAGVKIGKVVNIALEEHKDYPDQPVAVYLGIDQTINLYDSDQFVVEQGGLLGEQYISVRRLSNEEIVATYGPDYVPRALGLDAHRSGGEVVGFAALADHSQQLIKQAHATLNEIKATFADQYTREQIHQILLNINRATAQANTIADRVLMLTEALARTGEAGQRQVAHILDEVSVAAENINITSEQIRLAATAFMQGGMPQQIVLAVSNIRKASEDMKTVAAVTRDMIATPAAKQQVQTALTNLAAASESVKALTASVKELVGDEQVTADLRATITNLHTTTENLRVITEQTREFFVDESNLENIEHTLENLRVVSEQGVEVTRKADQALDRVDQTMDRLGQLAGHFQPRYTEGYMDLEATDDRGLRADFNLRLQYGGKPLDFWRVGVRDIGDRETLNLQKSVPLGPRAWTRLGVIQSKIGLGLDYQMSPDLLLEAEAYDPDDTQIDLRGIYKLSPKWWLTLGLADSFGSRQTFIGTRRIVTSSNRRKDRTE